MIAKKDNDPSVYICKCPGCNKQIVYDSSNPYRPFCSKACKTEDLASWAEEEYRVKGAPLDENDAGYESEED